MRKAGFMAFVLAALASFANAQVPTSGNVFFGYSYYSTDASSLGRANTNGWEASLEGKVLPFIGLVADFDSHYGSQSFPIGCVNSFGVVTCTNVSADIAEHNVLFGPRASFSVGRFPLPSFWWGYRTST